MKKAILLVLLILLIAFVSCSIPEVDQEDIYNNSRIGNNIVRFERSKGVYHVYIMAVDMDLNWNQEYEGYEFACYINDTLVAQRKLNEFVFEPEAFMEEPMDLRFEILSGNQIVREFTLEKLMVYQPALERSKFNLARYKTAESLLILEGESIAELEKLSSLTYLNLWHSNADNLQPIESLKDLRILVLDRSQDVTDLSSIGTLSYLESLAIIDCDCVKDISPLVLAKRLQYVYLPSCSRIEEVVALAELPDLKYVNLLGDYKVQDRHILEEKSIAEIDAD